LDRLIVSTHKLPTRSDVVAMMAIGDVYLDTFPYSGSISLTDPLETGVPTLVCEDDSLRSRQGAALLRDIGLEELIAENAEQYITKAIELANDPKKRTALRGEILAAVSAKPRYLDPERYGGQLARLLEKIVREGLDAWNPDEAAREEQRDIATAKI
jgi:predicted O-linked N-acetylglucosamine transferase (SPINDLY family)